MATKGCVVLPLKLLAIEGFTVDISPMCWKPCKHTTLFQTLCLLLRFETIWRSIIRLGPTNGLTQWKCRWYPVMLSSGWSAPTSYAAIFAWECASFSGSLGFDSPWWSWPRHHLPRRSAAGKSAKSWFESEDGWNLFFTVTMAACVLPRTLLGSLRCTSQGAAGRKPCARRLNVLYKHVANTLSSPSASRFATILESDPSLFVSHTNESLWQTVEHLNNMQGNISEVDFQELERNMGMTWNDKGLMFAADLREWIQPMRTQYDMLHCFFVGGVVAVELGLFKQHLKSKGVSFDSLQQAVGFPFHSAHARMGLLRDCMFSDKQVWRAAGSQQLDLIPLIQHWVATQLPHQYDWAETDDVIRCFMSLRDRICYLDLLVRSNCQVFLDLLQKSQTEHHRLLVQIHGEQHVKPKHHFALHYPQTFLAAGPLDLIPRHAKKSTKLSNEKLKQAWQIFKILKAVCCISCCMRKCRRWTKKQTTSGVMFWSAHNLLETKHGKPVHIAFPVASK